MSGAPGGGGPRPLCIVTGATGLVGRHLLPRLSQTHDVLAIAREAGPALPQVEWLVADLAAPGWERALPARYDATMHLAQSRRFREFPAGAGDVLAVNVGAVARLAEHAVSAGVTHFVHLSTGGVYAPSHQPVHESAPLQPPATAGWYVGSKLAAESLVLAYRDQFIPVVLRPFFVYGAGQARAMLVPRLADAVRDGRPIPLTSASGIRLSLTHADDMVDAMIAALALEGPATLNVAGPDAMSIREIAETFSNLIGRAAVFDQQPPTSPVFDLIADRRQLASIPMTLTRRFAAHAATALS